MALHTVACNVVQQALDHSPPVILFQDSFLLSEGGLSIGSHTMCIQGDGQKNIVNCLEQNEPMLAWDPANVLWSICQYQPGYHGSSIAAA